MTDRAGQDPRPSLAYRTPPERGQVLRIVGGEWIEVNCSVQRRPPAALLLFWVPLDSMLGQHRFYPRSPNHGQHVELRRPRTLLRQAQDRHRPPPPPRRGP